MPDSDQLRRSIDPDVHVGGQEFLGEACAPSTDDDPRASDTVPRRLRRRPAEVAGFGGLWLQPSQGTLPRRRMEELMDALVAEAESLPDLSEGGAGSLEAADGVLVGNPRPVRPGLSLNQILSGCSGLPERLPLQHHVSTLGRQQRLFK